MSPIIIFIFCVFLGTTNALVTFNDADLKEFKRRTTQRFFDDEKLKELKRDTTQQPVPKKNKNQGAPELKMSAAATAVAVAVAMLIG
uniref:Uncharacterized protein n=1 Tax=Globodera pallida TaxID=36090 RepID=A0A183C038_GLOPA